MAERYEADGGCLNAFWMISRSQKSIESLSPFHFYFLMVFWHFRQCKINHVNGPSSPTKLLHLPICSLHRSHIVLYAMQVIKMHRNKRPKRKTDVKTKLAAKPPA